MRSRVEERDLGLRGAAVAREEPAGVAPSLQFSFPDPEARVCSSAGQSTRLISVGSLVQIQPDPPSFFGGVAQLGERLLCKQEVIGSIPFTSTISR